MTDATRPQHPLSQQVTQLERRYAAVLAVNWLATIFPAAVMVLYARSRGLSLADIGAYVAVYGVTVALLDLPTGNLADLAGRKRTALIGGAVGILARIMLLLSFSLPGFLVYAVLWGVTRALNSGTLDAWFVGALRDLDPELDLQPSLARVNTAELLALGGGSLLGAGLPSLLHLVWPGRSGGASPLTPVVAASLLLQVMALLVTWRLVQERPRPSLPLLRALGQGLSGLPDALRQAARLVRHDAVLPWLLALEGLIGVTLAACETFWQPFFASRFGLGGHNTVVFGVLLGGCYLAGMLGNLSAAKLLALVGRRADRLGRWTQVLQAAALLALAWQGTVWLAAGLLWLTYFARTAFSSSFLTLYNARVEDSRRSLMLSALSVAMFLGFSLGNLLLGVVGARTSISWAWTLVAAGLLLSLGLFRRLQVSTNPEPA